MRSKDELYVSFERCSNLDRLCVIGVREWSLFAFELRDDVELPVVCSILQITGTQLLPTSCVKYLSFI